MCDTPEIQGEWKPAYGDWVAIYFEEHPFGPGQIGYKNPHIIMPLCCSTHNRFKTLNGVLLQKDECLWLPRQDQIQEMLDIEDVDDFYFAIYDMFFESDNYHHYNSSPDWRTDNLKTVEQLWLAFYMHEKHQKKWGGERWVDTGT